MAAKRKMTPKRAASETRAGFVKRINTYFDVVDSWMDTLETCQVLALYSTLRRMRNDLEQYRKRELVSVRGQAARNKKRAGGI